jgi:PAS domain S-box-containing protein
MSEKLQPSKKEPNTNGTPFKRLFEALPDAVVVTDFTGNIQFANSRAEKMFGYDLEELLGKPVELLIPARFRQHSKHREAYYADPRMRPMESDLELFALRKEGVEFPVEIALGPLETAQGDLIVAIIRDISSRNLALQELQRSEARNRALLHAIPDLMIRVHRDGTIWDYHSVDLEESYIFSDASLGKKLSETLPQNVAEQAMDAIERVIETGKRQAFESSLLVANGLRHFETWIAPSAPDEFVCIIRDVTELKQAEERYRNTLDNMLEGCQIIGPDWRYIYVNEAVVRQGRMKPEELLGRTMMEAYPGIEDTELFRVLRRCMEDRLPDTMENEFAFQDGTTGWFELRIQPVPEGLFILSMDITERKRTRQAIERSEKRFRALIENSADAITLLDENGVTIYDSPAAPGLLGYGSDEMIGQNIFTLMHPDDLAQIQPLFQELVRTPGARSYNIFRIRHKDSSWRWIESVVTNLLAEPSVRAIVTNYRDVTDRKRAEEEIRSRTDELSTLYELSRALAEANALDEVLDLVNRRTVDIVHITFARIALLEGDELVTRSVYPVRVLDHNLFDNGRHSVTVMPYCRRILEQGDPVILRAGTRDVSSEEGSALLLDFAQTLCLVPLRIRDLALAQSRPLGLLMLGEARREEREPFTPEKLRLARSIGDQAAIAIENSRLFNDLQRSNEELTQAYDATIAGWSAALDLRDKETEGHTQRVTEMTVRLAERMGFSEAELVQVQRGALLHDIGKMGVPDRILLKPDKLTDKEWQVMRMHTVYAHEFLKPIAYLGSAVDIPYCHHEKWDGSGYPRGLKGEEIPLSARIFAIVDVYDALTSDRPYRAAWSKEKTLAHIRSLRGSHFDPQVVDVFEEFLREG